MNRTFLALAATLALALAWLGSLALAATTTTTVTLSGSAYTDLGAGPMLLSSNNGDMTYQVSDSQPSPGLSGHIVRQGVSRDFVQTTAHVWAIGPRDGVVAIVSAGTGISSSSGGGGGGGAVTGADPCFASLKTTAAFSGSAGSLRIITGVSSKKTYICAISYRVASAVNVSVIEGTGSNCGTGSAAMDGSTTAANGKAEAANGGEAAGNGSGDLMHTATNADDVCILQSGTALIAGRVSYVQQ